MVEEDNKPAKMDNLDGEENTHVVGPGNARDADSTGTISMPTDARLPENEGEAEQKLVKLTKAQLKIRKQEERKAQQKGKGVPADTTGMIATTSKLSTTAYAILKSHSKGQEATREAKAKLLRLRRIRMKKGRSRSRKI